MVKSQAEVFLLIISEWMGMEEGWMREEGGREGKGLR